MHTRGPFTGRLIQQMQKGAALRSHCAPAPEESTEPMECCGMSLCARMGLSLLGRVGSRQKAAVPAGRAAWSRENKQIVGALLYTQTRQPSPRKVWSQRDFAVAPARLLRVERVGCCSECTPAGAPARVPESSELPKYSCALTGRRAGTGQVRRAALPRTYSDCN